MYPDSYYGVMTSADKAVFLIALSSKNITDILFTLEFNVDLR
jgi:hypothetical protein